jgi:type I restriction enzyme S subunit
VRWVDGDAPEGWTLCELGDVVKVVGGGTPKTGVAGNFSEGGGHPWITPADLTGYTEKRISRGRRFLTDQGLATSSAKYMPAGTVLFSTRAPIGYVAVAANPVTTNQGFRSFIPNASVDSEYIYYALKFLRPLAEQLASGTTFAELSGTNAAKLPIAYPALEEQRAIVRVLDMATDKARTASEHLSVARRTIGRFRQAVLAAACTGRLTADWRAEHSDAPSVEHALSEQRGARKSRASREQAVELEMPTLPDGYVLGTIGDAATRLEYGTSTRATADAEQGIPVLRMGNIQNGRLDLSDLKYMLVDREIDRLLLEDGDLLFNRTNSPELVGKSAVFRGDAPMTFASYLIRVQLHPEVAEPDFVNYWITSAWGRIWARLAKTDGVSQSNINGSKLALMPIPLPPIDEQRVIVQRANQLLATADRLLQQLNDAAKKVDRSSQAVLAKAFRGDLSAMPEEAQRDSSSRTPLVST